MFLFKKGGGFCTETQRSTRLYFVIVVAVYVHLFFFFFFSFFFFVFVLAVEFTHRV